MANKNYLLNDNFPKAIKNATSTSDGLMSSEDKANLDSVFEFGLLTPVTPDKDGIMSKEDKIKLDNIKLGPDGTLEINIDNELSSTSENPVQNKVITEALNGKASTSIATIDTDGLMSAEDKVKLDSINDTLNLALEKINTLTQKISDLETQQAQMLAKLKTAVFIDKNA